MINGGKRREFDDYMLYTRDRSDKSDTADVKANNYVFSETIN